MGDSIRVLVVDDDEAMADLTATYLERTTESIDPVVETDPESALDTVEREPVDCVVSDYDMPAMDGLEFLTAVREATPDLPFVLFTGKGSEEIASEAISAGVTDYLQKSGGTEQYEVLANRVENAVGQYRAEREASEATDQMRRTLDRITDSFFSLDEEWRFQFVNDRAADFFDTPAEELLGEDIRELFPEGIDGAFHQAYEEALATNEPQTFETTSSLDPDHWYEVRAYPSDDGLSVYAHDVTERKRMESELRETKRKIEALYDVAARAVSCSHPDEIYDLAVEVAEDVLDFDRCAVATVESNELVPRAVSESVPDAGYYDAVPVSADDKLGAQVYRTGESRVVDDLDEADVDPAERDYQSALTVPLGEFGVFQVVTTEPGSFDAQDRELTELLATHVTESLRRVQTEHAMRAERDRFAALFENVPNAVVSCAYDDDGEPVVRAVNPAFEETFGWSAEDVVDEPLDKFIVPDGHDDEAASLNEQARGGGHVDGAEVRRVTADGVKDFLLDTGTVHEDGTTEDISVYTEITEQKERERQLARQNERLEEFASVVSHDLRNPLNVAQGHLELLAEERAAEGRAADESAPEAGSDGATDEHVVAIQRSVERMEMLVEDLLALARGGEAVTDTESLALETVAEEAWATVDTAEATLQIEDDRTLEAAEGRLRGLFENLFRNAVEHAGTAVTVRVGALDDEAGFYLADDGPGIPADRREDVFEHGYTTDSGGTGFGLAIVADVAEAHGWSVDVGESESGGARFEFRT